MGKLCVWPKKYLPDDLPNPNNSLQDNSLRDYDLIASKTITHHVWIRAATCYP